MLRLIGKSSRGSDSEPECGEILRSLCSSDVLQWLERTDTLQVNPLVQEFARGCYVSMSWGFLPCSRRVSRPSKQATAQILEGSEPLNPDYFAWAQPRCQTFARQIRLAIGSGSPRHIELAEQAKSADAAMPIAQRYRSVLEAYDQ